MVNQGDATLNMKDKELAERVHLVSGWEVT